MSSDYRIPQHLVPSQDQLEDLELDLFDELYGDVAASPSEPAAPLYPQIESLPSPQAQYPLSAELNCLSDLFELQDDFTRKSSAFDPSQDVDTHPIHKSLHSLMTAFVRIDSPFLQTLDFFDANMQRLQKHSFNFILGIGRSNRFIEEVCGFVKDPSKRRELEIAARAHLYHIILEKHPGLPQPQLNALLSFRTKGNSLPCYGFNQTPLVSKLASTINLGRHTFETLFIPEPPSTPTAFSLITSTTSEDPLPLLTQVLSKSEYESLSQFLEADRDQKTYHPYSQVDPINEMLGRMVVDLCSHPDFPLNIKRFSIGGSRFGIHWTKLNLTAKSNDACSPYIDKLCALGVSDEQKALLYIGVRRLFGEYIRAQLVGKHIAPETEALILSIETNGGKMPVEKIGILRFATHSALQEIRRAGFDPLNSSVSSDGIPLEHLSTFHPLSPHAFHPIELWIQKRVDAVLSSPESPLRSPNTSTFEIVEQSNERLAPFIKGFSEATSNPVEKKILELAVRRHIVNWVSKTMAETDLIPFDPDMPKFLSQIENHLVPETLLFQMTNAAPEGVYQILSSAHAEPSTISSPRAMELPESSSSDVSLSPSHQSTSPLSSDLEFDVSDWNQVSPIDQEDPLPLLTFVLGKPEYAQLREIFTETISTLDPYADNTEHPLDQMLDSIAHDLVSNPTFPLYKKEIDITLHTFRIQTHAAWLDPQLDEKCTAYVEQICAIAFTPQDKIRLEIAIRRKLVNCMAKEIDKRGLISPLGTNQVFRQIATNKNQMTKDLLQLAALAPPSLIVEEPSEWVPSALDTVPTETVMSSSTAQSNKPAEILLWLFETSSLRKLTQISDVQRGFELHDPEFHALAQRFHELSTLEKGQIYFNLWECAGKPDIPDFGKNYLFANTFNFYRAFIRFLDQTVTEESLLAAYSLLPTEQRESVLQGALIPTALRLHDETLTQLQKLTAYIPRPVAASIPPPPPLPRDAPVVPTRSVASSSSSTEALNDPALVATIGRLKKRWEIPYFWSTIPYYVNSKKPLTDVFDSNASVNWYNKNKPELKHYKAACEKFIGQIPILQDPVTGAAARALFHALLAQARVEETDSDSDDSESIVPIVTESKIDAIFGKEDEILSRDELQRRFESQMAQIERSEHLLSKVKKKLPDMSRFGSLSQLRTTED
ncbi:MAG: hypothetical protein V4492_09750 [Chlamydiota bacterium]